MKRTLFTYTTVFFAVFFCLMSVFNVTYAQSETSVPDQDTLSNETVFEDGTEEAESLEGESLEIDPEELTAFEEKEWGADIEPSLENSVIDPNPPGFDPVAWYTFVSHQRQGSHLVLLDQIQGD